MIHFHLNLHIITQNCKFWIKLTPPNPWGGVSDPESQGGSNPKSWWDSDPKRPRFSPKFGDVTDVSVGVLIPNPGGLTPESRGGSDPNPGGDFNPNPCRF